MTENDIDIPILVGALEHIFCFSICWVSNHPNWYFSEGLKPQNSKCKSHTYFLLRIKGAACSMPKGENVALLICATADMMETLDFNAPPVPQVALMDSSPIRRLWNQSKEMPVPMQLACGYTWFGKTQTDARQMSRLVCLRSSSRLTYCLIRSFRCSLMTIRFMDGSEHLHRSVAAVWGFWPRFSRCSPSEAKLEIRSS